MAADSNKTTKIQHNDGGDMLTAASGGTIEALSGSTVDIKAGASLKIGSDTVMPALPVTNGLYMVKLASGVATFVASIPELPASDGNYVLNIASGVATWVAETP